MQLLLDNLLAVVIASTIFLMMVGMSARNMEDNLDSINSYARKKTEFGFVETLNQDLHSVDSLLTPFEDPSDSTFVFFRPRSHIDPTLVQVTYRRRYVETRDTTKLYQIERTIDGETHVASMATLTHWTIQARNSMGENVNAGNLDTATQIYVRFEAAAPFKEDETVSKSRWEASFHLPLLRSGVAL